MDKDHNIGTPIPTFKEVTGVKDGCFLDKDGNPIDPDIADIMRDLQDTGLEGDRWELVSFPDNE